MKALGSGWAIRPRKAKAPHKYHFYEGGTSLCKRDHFKGPYTAPRAGEGQSPIDCKTCWATWRKRLREPWGLNPGVTAPCRNDSPQKRPS